MTRPQPAPENLFDAIAKLLKPEQREYFYQRMMYFRHLRPEDEILRIAEAMGFLALVIRETPQEMANEREQFAEVLARSMESMQVAHRANMKYHQQLEERLTQLPTEIAKGISAETIAAKLGESLRQQFQETGLPAVANAIGAQATTLRHTSKELSAVLGEFSHPRTGAAPRMKEALSSMKDDLKNAADHVRVQMNGLGKELWQTIAPAVRRSLGAWDAGGHALPALDGHADTAATATRTGGSVGTAGFRPDSAEPQKTPAAEPAAVNREFGRA